MKFCCEVGMLYRTNWRVVFFFFQLLGMSTPHCPAFRSRGCVHSRELIWMEVCPPRRLRLPAQPGFMMGLLRTSPITSCRAFVSLFCLHHQWGFPQCTQPTVPWLLPLQTKPLFLENASAVASVPFTIGTVRMRSHDSRGFPCECLVRFLRKIPPKWEANPVSMIHKTLPFSG